MTDEAPTAAEVEALIARLRTYPEDSSRYAETLWVRCQQAAAALAAQAQRIAEQGKLLQQARDSLSQGLETDNSGFEPEWSKADRKLVVAIDAALYAAPAAAPGEKP